MNELYKVLRHYKLDTNSNKIICPFHDDLNPSMLVNFDNNSFYCFGCQVSGDAFKFYQLLNKNLDDLQACIKFHKVLASEDTEELKQKIVVKKVDNRQATIEAMDYYNGLSQTKWEAERSKVKDYLIRRGFTNESLTLARAKINYNKDYPVIFPMLDNGQFKGWVCRTTSKEIEKKRKYLYNEGFSRRSTLVGDYKTKTIVVVEGYMDWLKFRQYGYKNVVAILGWKISSNQIEKLKDKGVEFVISALDNDTCGKKGTAYLKKFFDVIPLQYPEGIKDPGEMTLKVFQNSIQKTKKVWRKMQNGTN